MPEVFIGEKVINKNGETGTIVAYDGGFITVDFQGRIEMYQHDAVFEGFLKYENPDMQRKAYEAIEAEMVASIEEYLKEEEARIAEKRAKREQAASKSIKFESTVST